MRGRAIFTTFKYLLNFLVFLLRLMPVRLVNLLWDLFNGTKGFSGLGVRYVLAKRLAFSFGENVYIGPDVEIRGWSNFSVGSNVSIHRTCYIDASGGVKIGDDVSIAHQSSIISFDHTWQDASLPIRDNPVVFKNIVIGNDVWIGCGCRVLAGAIIGSRSIIAAGAVVIKEVESNSLAGGVPAKKVKSI